MMSMVILSAREHEHDQARTTPLQQRELLSYFTLRLDMVWFEEDGEHTHLCHMNN